MNNRESDNLARIGVIVQARTSSTRLPAKVLKELPYGSGITVLEQVIRRLKKSKYIDAIIIATTIEDDDVQIVSIAKRECVEFYRGSRDNVLERYYLAAKDFQIDTIVRITSDCPCIDYEVVDEVIKKHLDTHADYTSNNIKRTFPYGIDVEVFSFNALEMAFNSATEWHEKEHVTPYIYKTRRDLFRLQNVSAPEHLTASNLRITLDTLEDYALLCAIYDYLYYENNFFGLSEIVRLFRQKPWLELINKKIAQKKIFDSINAEILEAIRILDMQDLKRAKKILQDIYQNV